MDEPVLTWNRSMRVWWLIIWRTMIGGVVFAAAVGFVAGFINALVGKPLNAAILGGILGYLVSLVWSAFVVRMALKKRYRDFRFVLVPNPDPARVFD
jgi:hypothetical protein